MFYFENIAALNALDSRVGKSTSSKQTPMPQPVTGQQMQAGEPKENVPHKFTHAVKLGHGNRTFSGDVTNHCCGGLQNYR